MRFVLAELFWVGLVPCVVAAVMVARRRFILRPAAVWATSVGGAIIVGQFALTARRGGWSAALDSLLRPNEAAEWLPWLVLVAAGIGVLAAYAPRPPQRWIAALACIFAFTVPLRLLAGSVYVTSRWSAIEKLGVFVLWSAVLAAMWFLLAVGRANRQMRVRGGLLVVVAVGMAITITLSGSFTTGELCGVVAAALTGTLLGAACFSTPGATDSAGAGDDVPSSAAGVLTVALGGLIFMAYYYASLTATNAALLTVAAVAAGGRLPTVWPRSPMGQAALRAALCVMPLAIALFLAYAAVQGDQSANPYAS